MKHSKCTRTLTDPSARPTWRALLLLGLSCLTGEVNGSEPLEVPGDSPAPPLLRLRPAEIPNLAPRRALGNSVAMDLDTALVGDPGGPAAAGRAYVFTRSLTGQWQPQALLSGSGQKNDEFGVSVAVAGETALVGTGPTAMPTAYVFVRTGTTWSRQALLSVGRGMMSVALARGGDRAVVGVSGSINPVLEVAYVFARQDDGSWTQEAVLQPSPGTGPGSGFGAAVAILEDRVAIGAQGENGGNGAVYVFDRDATGHWERQARLALKSDHPPALFGWSVALAQDTLMVGAFGENDYRGAAYLFQQTSSGLWSRQARLIPEDPHAPYQCFGFSVALTPYGALIGQPCDGEGTRQATHVSLFSRTQTSGTELAWTRRGVFTSPLAPSTVNFGAALATNGLDVIIGSPGEEPGGAAYVLECLPCLLYGQTPP